MEKKTLAAPVRMTGLGGVPAGAGGAGGAPRRRAGGATHKNIPQFFGYFRPSPENPAICEQCIVVDDELLIRQISPSTAKHFIKILLEYL